MTTCILHGSHVQRKTNSHQTLWLPSVFRGFGAHFYLNEVHGSAVTTLFPFLFCYTMCLLILTKMVMVGERRVFFRLYLAKNYTKKVYFFLNGVRWTVSFFIFIFWEIAMSFF